MIDYTGVELDAIAEAEQAVADSDPVRQKVSYVTFVSKSKGRGRRRKREVEVELIGYGDRFHTWATFPFDTAASEIYGHTSDDGEERLKREIPNRAKRRA